MTELVHQMVDVLLGSDCDLGDERATLRALMAGNAFEHGLIMKLHDEAVERAKIMKDHGMIGHG